MTTTRAKLYVSEATRGAGAPDAVRIVLAAVTRGDENKSWAEATPVAKFEMTIQNPEAAAVFYVGQEFYVDFTPVPAPSKIGKDHQIPGDSNLTLADPHDYEPSEYERNNPDSGHHYRCQKCNCKRQSHDEPLRSTLVERIGLPVSA